MRLESESYEYPEPEEVEHRLERSRDRLASLKERRRRLRDRRKWKLYHLDVDYAAVRELQLELDMTEREIEWYEIRVQALEELRDATEFEAEREKRAEAWHAEVEEALLDFAAAVAEGPAALDRALEAHDRLSELENRVGQPWTRDTELEIPTAEERRAKLAAVARDDAPSTP